MCAAEDVFISLSFCCGLKDKGERVWKSNLGDFESSVYLSAYGVCVSLSLVSFYYKIYDDDDDDDYVSCSTPVLVSPTAW